MPASLIPALLDMFTDDIGLRYPASVDAFGEPGGMTSVSPSPKGRIVDQTMQVRGAAGKMVKSSQHVVLAGVFGVQVTWEITLPDRYPIRQPAILGTKISMDENGPHHETVYLA